MNMGKYDKLWFLAAGAALLAPLGYAAAPAPDAEPIYKPVTSDIMNDVIQPRHIKLWLAGKNKNWAFAEYERHNLQGAFGRWAAAIPVYHDAKVSDMTDAFTKVPFADLDAAIKAKDETAFVKAYGRLTEGCNYCHQSTGHQIAVIQVPSADAFPDQDFKPQTH
jgi:hypothetical protein